MSITIRPAFDDAADLMEAVAACRAERDRLVAERDYLLDTCRYLRRFLEEYDVDHEFHPSLRERLDKALELGNQGGRA